MLKVPAPAQSPYRLDDLAGVLTDVMASINSSIEINWLGLYPPATATELPAVHVCLATEVDVDLVRVSVALSVGAQTIQDDLQGGFRAEIAGAELAVWTLEGGLR
jgi:hypothetical protein